MSRRRFALVAALCAGVRAGRTLEVGYGSGVFMPELARSTDELYGIDVHGHAAQIERTLQQHGIHASLRAGAIESSGFPDSFFDRIVAVSALEFVSDLERACAEMRRVLNPQGRLVVVAPRASPVLDALLRIATGASAKSDFEDRRERLRPTLLRFFALERALTFPAVPLPAIYEGLRLRKPQ